MAHKYRKGVIFEDVHTCKNQRDPNPVERPSFFGVAFYTMSGFLNRSTKTAGSKTLLHLALILLIASYRVVCYLQGFPATDVKRPFKVLGPILHALC